MARFRDHYVGPSVDAAVESAVDDAMAAVARDRNFPLEWPPNELAVLVSLAAAIAARLPDTVARCRGDALSWTEIGDLLGTTKQSARARYAAAVDPQLPGDSMPPRPPTRR